MEKSIQQGSWYTFNWVTNEKATITGYDPTKKVVVGSLTSIGAGEDEKTYKVTNIKRRNHKGDFANSPEKAKNSFYTATIELIS